MLNLHVKFQNLLSRMRKEERGNFMEYFLLALLIIAIAGVIFAFLFPGFRTWITEIGNELFNLRP